MSGLKEIRAIGLTFCVLALGARGESAGEGTTDRVVEGFAEVVSYANGGQMYDTCRGERRLSWWEYDDGKQTVEWKTAPVPERYTSGRITFVWSCGMTAREGIDVPHDLYLNGRRVITFVTPVQDTVHQRDRLWREGEYTLFYDYVRTNRYGDSFGVMHLTVPASAISPGEAATLKVVGSPSGVGSFFMLTDYTDTVEWLRTRYGGGPVPGVGEVTNEKIASLRAKLRDEEERARLSAASDLIRLGERSGVPALADLLLKGRVETRRAAAEDLGKIRDRSAAEALALAMEDEDEQVRMLAEAALEVTDPERATEIYVEKLKDSDAAVRRAAVEGLGRLRSGSAVEPLADALDDEDEGVRIAALNALGNIGDASTVPAFTRIFRTGDREMRLAAVAALTKMGDRSAVPPLVRALEDEDREVRLLSARALVEMPDRTAVPALVTALKDEYVWVRDAAAYALGEIGDRSVVPALIEALGDDDEFVRKAVGAALCTITGRTWLGTDRERWRMWWEQTGEKGRRRNDKGPGADR